MKELEILKEIIKICEKHQLTYFAIGGTCLGAVRHSGFIPWDDDIDIGVPRKDYEKLKEIVNKELPENLEWLDGDICKSYSLLFSKVHDKNTALIERHDVNLKDRYSGVFIDIMPFDGFPKPGLMRTAYIKILKILIAANYRFRLDPEGTGGRSKVFYALLSVLRKILPYNFFSKIRTKLQKLYSFEKSEYTSFAWGWQPEKLILNRKDFDNYIKVRFEDIEIRCPAGYDNYLTDHFGDYRKLPPKEQRVSGHDVVILDLKESYERYK